MNNLWEKETSVVLQEMHENQLVKVRVRSASTTTIALSFGAVTGDSQCSTNAYWIDECGAQEYLTYQSP